MAEVPRYRFGPLERRGVLAGLRLTQLMVIGTGSIVMLAALRSLNQSVAVGLCLLIVALVTFSTFVPIGGRALDEWMPVLWGWIIVSVTGRHRFIAKDSLFRPSTIIDPQPQFPPCLKGLTILAQPVAGSDGCIGIVKDHKVGTYTAVLAVRGKSFALLDGPEKARRLAGWAGILAGMAREGGLINRLQWVERTVPDPGDEIGTYLKDNLTAPVDSLIARSYLQVVDEAGPVTQQHECFVALQISARRAARAIKAAGGGDAGACEVLRRELAALSSKLVTAEIGVDGALTPRLVAGAIRTAFDPRSRVGLARIAARDPKREGTSISNSGPMAAEANWSSYRCDDAWHRTYWIAEWPRIDADPDFLAPLLLRTEKMRTVSVVMEPINPLRAIRNVESARTAAAADEELRNRAGFMATARRLREQQALADHERDLSNGHAFYRFAGFVTVTAPDQDELELACGEIEEAAGRSFLDLRRLSGQQEQAFTFTLPLCRGLR